MDPRKRIVDEKIGRLVKKRDLEFLKRNLLLRETFPLSFFLPPRSRTGEILRLITDMYVRIYIYMWVSETNRHLLVHSPYRSAPYRE